MRFPLDEPSVANKEVIGQHKLKNTSTLIILFTKTLVTMDHLKTQSIYANMSNDSWLMIWHKDTYQIWKKGS